jgi:hypothetical protein
MNVSLTFVGEKKHCYFNTILFCPHIKMQNSGLLISYVGFLMHVPLESLYSQKEMN